MDNIQKEIIKILEENPDCLVERKKLKALLMDFLPQNKLQQNLILNAFDEDIIGKLSQSSDITLSAIQMVKYLSDSFGLTKDASMWSIVTWCYILKHNEVAEAIESMGYNKSCTNPTAFQSTVQNAPKLKLGYGMYLAGVDFPAGNIKLEPINNDGEEIYYEIIQKNTNSTVENGFFITQFYLTVTEGQRLEVDNEVYLSSI